MLVALMTLMICTNVTADEVEGEEYTRPMVEYELPPFVKVNHEGRELRCFNVGEDWKTINRVVTDYRFFHLWAPLIEADMINLESYVAQLTLEVSAGEAKYDSAKAGWDFNRNLYLDERSARVSSERSGRVLRSVLLGSLVVAIAVIGVESVAITLDR